MVELERRRRQVLDAVLKCRAARSTAGLLVEVEGRRAGPYLTMQWSGLRRPASPQPPDDRAYD